MTTDGAAMHRALEASFEVLYDAFDGVRFERRSVILARPPEHPVDDS